jgi:hypothetical protein
VEKKIKNRIKTTPALLSLPQTPFLGSLNQFVLQSDMQILELLICMDEYFKVFV